MSQESGERGASNSAPEDLFVDLFAQVFGVENATLLASEYPVQDIYGGSRAIDFALRTADQLIAIEIDGLTWHVPEAVPVEKYEDDLLRQNSLIHQGWRVFRWTDRQIVQEPERVKEELALFLERVPGLLSFDDFLPKQRGELLELRPHQEQALQSLVRMRAEGKTIALLHHAQGAGKTLTAITDAQRVGGRTLYLAHTRDLVLQARDEFRRHWPQASAGLYLGGEHEPDAHNVIGSIQSVSDNLTAFPPDVFAYLVIDEAHHATAATYRRVLGHFRPRFVLGLTATPDRADGESVLELFRDCAHRLSLREAVESGELVPIRCVRVRTNVDLSRVRYNQVQYNRRDIEETVMIPARDRLIVDTYLKHVRGKKAVAFCVNVRHGEEVADLFRRAGVPAESVSGQMPNRRRQECLQAFQAGRTRVLCACDILNEGWNCPDVEVLLMARPTLSRVIYLQQLGRGTRKAPGKECLVVFDFVDNATRYNQSLSLHRVLGQGRYRDGGLVLAPGELLAAEEQALARGEKPTAVLEIGLWAKDFEQVDVFNWQDTAGTMYSVAELELTLGAAEGTVRRAIERGTVTPDHTLPLGERTYHYFRKERAEEIRAALGLPATDEHNIRDRFLEFVTTMDMTTSYKPVMLLALLNSADENGKAPASSVAQRFRQFYDDRRAQGLVVEQPSAVMARVDMLDDTDVLRVMLRSPFDKFGRREYLRHGRDLADIRFDPRLWRQLAPEHLEKVRAMCNQAIVTYYERLAKKWVPVLRDPAGAHRRSQ
jgi:superfamily II DNA or RNA helicase